MHSTNTYSCSNCGKQHEEWPALTFDSPTSYHLLPVNLKNNIAELSSDFCTVRHPDQTDRFIRGTLTINVLDHCQDLEYGVWVSLSEKSFDDYATNYGNHDHENSYFGWLSNDIPDYDVIASIPTTVYTRPGGLRPEIVPHKEFDHQLVRDYYNGISRQEAGKRIAMMLQVIQQREKEPASKTKWWRFWES